MEECSHGIKSTWWKQGLAISDGSPEHTVFRYSSQRREHIPEQLIEQIVVVFVRQRRSLHLEVSELEAELDSALHGQFSESFHCVWEASSRSHKVQDLTGVLRPCRPHRHIHLVPLQLLEASQQQLIDGDAEDEVTLVVSFDGRQLRESEAEASGDSIAAGRAHFRIQPQGDEAMDTRLCDAALAKHSAAVVKEQTLGEE